MIFVFGSNLAGIHGAGAAKHAIDRHGAVYGFGVGYAGNSYAIPTKDCRIRTLPLAIVERYVNQFLGFAGDHHASFQVTRIGCGLAGFRDEQIAPLFLMAPTNCLFDEAWRPWLSEDVTFWGTFESDLSPKTGTIVPESR